MRSTSHIAYHITDLDDARRFYGEILGCEEVRSTDAWVDFDFLGHQISLHLGKALRTHPHRPRRRPYGDDAHLGVVLPLEAWKELAARLEAAGIALKTPPVTRLKGQPGERRTMFFCDPSGNPIEVNGVKDFDPAFPL